MEYLQISGPGENQYLATRFSYEEDDIEIGDYLSVEAYYVFPADGPYLDDCPLDEDKKHEESTFDLTDEVPKDPSPPPHHSSSPVPPTDSTPPVPPTADTVTFPPRAVERYREVFRGSKDDTVELNINFKTLLVHYFRELRLLNELNEYEMRHVGEFSERVPSFASLMLFLQEREENSGIRERALELFSSQECMRRIITGRSRMKNKLQMIKFVEKVRLNILTKGKGYKWKDVVKRTP